MAAPLRGTQSLVGQMGWVFARPSLTVIEVAWRWLFGVPLLAVCWIEARQILLALPPEAAGVALMSTMLVGKTRLEPTFMAGAALGCYALIWFLRSARWTSISKLIN